MRSKANFKTHPIHPALVHFPIAFLPAALIFNLLGIIFKDSNLSRTGGYLAILGIICGVLAAIPGFIDYLYTVPPDSSARTRALKHMIVNLCSLSLFFVGVLIGSGVNSFPSIITLVFQFVGVILLAFGGWMGGTMVFRNQIGVDHRYAGAGKWKEEGIERTDGGKKWRIGQGEWLKLNQMELIHLDGKRLVVAKTEEGYAVFEDRCTHKGASLSDGTISCGIVQCPWHGSQFNVFNGQVKAGPATEPIKCFRVVTEGNQVFLVFDNHTKS